MIIAAGEKTRYSSAVCVGERKASMINLGDARKPVQALIESSLTSFASEKSDVTWCTFALYACPWAGWISTNFDTEANSARITAEFGANGPDWYAEDRWGRFNPNCPDFEFVNGACWTWRIGKPNTKKPTPFMCGI